MSVGCLIAQPCFEIPTSSSSLSSSTGRAAASAAAPPKPSLVAAVAGLARAVYSVDWDGDGTFAISGGTCPYASSTSRLVRLRPLPAASPLPVCTVHCLTRSAGDAPAGREGSGSSGSAAAAAGSASVSDNASGFLLVKGVPTLSSAAVFTFAQAFDAGCSAGPWGSSVPPHLRVAGASGVASARSAAVGSALAAVRSGAVAADAEHEAAVLADYGGKERP